MPVYAMNYSMLKFQNTIERERRFQQFCRREESNLGGVGILQFHMSMNAKNKQKGQYFVNTCSINR
jgi:hypothetical protein